MAWWGNHTAVCTLTTSFTIPELGLHFHEADSCVVLVPCLTCGICAQRNEGFGKNHKFGLFHPLNFS